MVKVGMDDDDSQYLSPEELLKKDLEPGNILNIRDIFPEESQITLGLLETLRDMVEDQIQIIRGTMSEAREKGQRKSQREFLILRNISHDLCEACLAAEKHILKQEEADAELAEVAEEEELVETAEELEDPTPVSEPASIPEKPAEAKEKVSTSKKPKKGKQQSVKKGESKGGAPKDKRASQQRLEEAKADVGPDGFDGFEVE